MQFQDQQVTEGFKTSLQRLQEISKLPPKYLTSSLRYSICVPRMNVHEILDIRKIFLLLDPCDPDEGLVMEDIGIDLAKKQIEFGLLPCSEKQIYEARMKRQIINENLREKVEFEVKIEELGISKLKQISRAQKEQKRRYFQRMAFPTLSKQRFLYFRENYSRLNPSNSCENDIIKWLAQSVSIKESRLGIPPLSEQQIQRLRKQQVFDQQNKIYLGSLPQIKCQNIPDQLFGNCGDKIMEIENQKLQCQFPVEANTSQDDEGQQMQTQFWNSHTNRSRKYKVE